MKPLFEHTFIDNDSAITLVGLHGTGGSKKDFLFLNGILGYEYNILGIAGNISEDGYARFFKRHEVGFFDQQSLTEESEKLVAFIATWVSENASKAKHLVFIGNSNGANMILATLLKHPDAIKTAVLLHAMVPFEFDAKSVDFSDKKLFVSIGKKDEYITPLEQEKLATTLQATKASLTIKKYENGHTISKEEIRDVIAFLKKFIADRR